MKLKLCSALLTVATVFAPFYLVAEQTQDAGAKRNAIEKYGKLPLSFEPTDSTARFLARSGSYTVSVGASESSVAVTDEKSGKHQMLRFSFDNSSPAVRLEALEPQPGVTNYYIGQDPAKWRLGVKSFAKLRAPGVYPGVDVVYYGDHRRLEFDFVVAPKVDPGVIALSFAGMDKFYKDADGDLVAELAGHDVRFAKPYAYQKVGGLSKAVDAEYVLAGNGKVHLRVGEYDRNSELIVDPVVSYATYLGGSSGDVGNGIAVDNAGNAYITGQTCSANFPEGSVDIVNYTFEGACDAFVTKYSVGGTSNLYTTILGGTVPANATAAGNGIAVDNASLNPQVYVIGTTNISKLPMLLASAANNYQGGDSDAFISILDANTGLLARTSYLGGSSADFGYGIAVDQATPPHVIAVGQTCSQDFPGYAAFETKIEACAAFITELDNALDIASPELSTSSPGYMNPELSAFAPAPQSSGGESFYFSEFYNGQQTLGPYPTASWSAYTPFPQFAIVLDNLNPPHSQMATNSGCSGAYVPPSTTASNPIPDWNSALNGTTIDGQPITIDKLSCGTPIVWRDLGPFVTPVYHTTAAYGVALDPQGDIYVAGGTNTPSLFPYSQWTGSGAWILKVHGAGPGIAGTPIYGTVLETNATDLTGTIDTARAVAVDSESRAYVTGTASGSIFTTANAYQSAVAGGTDAFLLRMNTGGSAIDYSTYLGGSGNEQGLGVAVDGSFSPYVTGSTKSTNFPSINPISDPNTGVDLAPSGVQSAFVTRFTADGSGLILASYLGGSQEDQGNAIAVIPDPQNTVAVTNYDMYVAGTTSSPDFETLLLPFTLNQNNLPQFGYGTTANPGPLGTSYVPPLQSYGGVSDAFVAMLLGSSLPSTAITPGSLTFDGQSVGTTSASQGLKFAIQGSSDVQITGITFSNPDFRQAPTAGGAWTAADCYANVDLGPDSLTNPTGCTLSVTFTPSLQTPEHGTLSVQDNTSTTPHVIQLSGSSVVPTATYKYSTLSFGNQALGVVSAPIALTITNASTNPSASVVINSITMSGANPGDFAETDDCSSALTLQNPVNPSCTVNVTFTPSADKARSVTLSIADTTQSTAHTFAFTGQGVLVQSTVSSINAFQPQATNILSGAQTVTVKNIDPLQTLVVTGATATPGFLVTNNCAGSSGILPAANPNPSCTINVQFDPATAGPQTGTLTISGNGVTTTSNWPALLSLSGTAGANAALVVSPTTPTLTANAGLTGTQQWTLTNNSSFSLNIYNISIGGASASLFAVANNCGTALPAAGSCTITVSFNPTAAGNFSAALNISSDAANLAVTPLAGSTANSAAILGVGTAPTVTLVPPINSTVTFPNQPEYVAATPASITLKNTGTGPLNIPANGITITGTNAGDFSQTNNCGQQVIAGASCTIGITFTPSALSSRTATLNIADNAVPSSQTVNLVGNGVPVATPSITPSLGFLNQPLNQLSAPQVVTITNNDPNYPLTLSAPVFTGDFQLASSSTPCGTLLANKGSGSNTCTIGVTFTPTALGARTGTLSVATNGGSTPLTAQLSGTGTAPLAALSVTNYTFPNQALGTTSNPPYIVTLMNTGTGPLNIPNNGITISGTNAGDFSQTNTCGSQVAAQVGNTPGSCTISVVFTPSGQNSRTATLSIIDNAVPSPQTVTLLGNGVQVATPTISTIPSFPNQALNQASTPQTVTITNTDPNYSLTLGAPAFTGDFKLAPSLTTCGTLLGKKGSGSNTCNIGVTFTPTASGTRAGTLTVATNGGSTPLAVQLTGVGGASASVSPSTLSLVFSSTNVTQSSVAQSVILNNASIFPVNISSVVTGGAGAGEFLPTNNCGTIVPAATNGNPGSCTISVIFSPTATGIQTATMTISSDAATPFATVGLTGTGATPVPLVSLSVTNYTFPNQALGTTSNPPYVVVLTNTGAGPLNIPNNGITITGTNAGDFAQTNNCGSQVAAQVGNTPGSCAISVAFTPSGQNSRTAILNIADNAVPSPQTVNLVGNGVQVAPPSIPSSLNFQQNQPLNQVSAPQTVTITNTDPNYPLTLSTPVFTGDFQLAQSSTTCGTLLAKKGSGSNTCNIGVTFTPTASGARTGTLTVATNGGSTPLLTNLTGTGGASASVTPATLNLLFGNTNVTESSVAQSVILNNTSTFPVNITSITTGGAGAGEFLPTNNCGTIVPAAAANPGSCSISVIFSPTASGIQTATMTISSDAATPFAPVALTGTGTTPVVSVLQAGLPITSVTFLNQAENVASTPIVLTLKNTGTGPLNFSSAMTITGPAAGDFSQTNNCGQQVTAGSSCTINITFTPSALNSRVAALVLSDDALNSPQSIALSGTGISGAGVIQLTPSPLAFGTVQVGTSSTLTVTLTNTSSASALAVNTIPQPSNADFTQTNNCPASLAINNATCQIQVTFKPGSAIKESATLIITGSASNSPQTLNITGTGTTASSGSTGFTFASSDNGGEAVTVGDQAVFNIAVTPLNNFAESITFTCAGPAGSTCSVTPNPLTMDGVTVPTVKLYVNTNGGNGGSAKLAAPRLGSKSIFLALLPFSLMGILLINKRRGMWLVLALVGLCLLMGLASCGTGTGSAASSNGPLAAGTYQVTLTGAASGSSTQTNTLTLTLVVNKQ
jgi:hypothetical protein